MDVLEVLKRNNLVLEIMNECIKQARQYIKKRKPDIANQYTALAMHAREVNTSKEAMYYKTMLVSLNTINELCK